MKNLTINVKKIKLSNAQREQVGLAIPVATPPRNLVKQEIVMPPRSQIKQEMVHVVQIKQEKQIEVLSSFDHEVEVIDLEEDVKNYRYFCLECEDCPGDGVCDHTSHARVPLEFDMSRHIAATGHVAVRPIRGMLESKHIKDVAYSLRWGAEVRKQWKDMVLQGSYIPSQFPGSKACKWLGCKVNFEDAVEAFKHIRDEHLRAGTSSMQVGEAEWAGDAPPSWYGGHGT